MPMLIEGEWVQETGESDEQGRFRRLSSKFHGRVEDARGAEFPLEPGRYHLYIARACPWAHRTAIARAMMGLEEAIGLSIVHPYMGEDGWTFAPGPDTIPDTVNGARLLRELYVKAKPDCTGKVTVPVLWDKARGTIVNNDSRAILRMLVTAFRPLAAHPVELSPLELRGEIDAALDAIYGPINDGVYRCGFAKSQEAYDEAAAALFDALDRWEAVLGRQRWMCGERMTEADVCLFTTLYRFDAAYAIHFKCSKRRVVDYPNLWGFTRDVYQQPYVKGTCNLEAVREHYYTSHRGLNPRGIVPVGPIPDFEAAHGRG